MKSFEKFVKKETKFNALSLAQIYLDSYKNELEIAKENFKLTGEKEGSLEEAELKTREIFQEQFAKPYQEFLNMDINFEGEESFKFANVINKHLENIKVAEGEKQKLELQKKFVGDLVDKLNNIPVGTWSLSPKQTLETGKANCSNLSAILAMIVESTKNISGIKDVKYVEPYGHAANMVHFEDGTIYFADSRNGNFTDVTENIKIDDQAEIVVYENTEISEELPVRFLPAMKPLEKGVAHTFAGNIVLLPDAAAGKFDEVLQMYPDEKKEDIIKEAMVINQNMKLTDEDVTKRLRLDDLVGRPINKFTRTSKYLEDKDRMENLHRREILLK